MNDLSPRVRRLVRVVAYEALWLDGKWWEETHGHATVKMSEVRFQHNRIRKELLDAIADFKRVREYQP